MRSLLLNQHQVPFERCLMERKFIIIRQQMNELMKMDINLLSLSNDEITVWSEVQASRNIIIKYGYAHVQALQPLL